MKHHASASGRRAVDAVVAALRAAGIHAEGIIREPDGDVARSVLDTADECNARLIVLGAKGCTDMPRPLVSSLATRVMRDSRLAVLIMPPSDELASVEEASAQPEPEPAGCLS